MGRTARYTKAANWSYINMVAKCQDESIPALPIVGNGDVFSWRDYAEKRELAPATPLASLPQWSNPYLQKSRRISSLSEDEMSQSRFSFNSVGSQGLIKAPRASIAQSQVAGASSLFSA